nr:unnamed protein product [Callosobruchus chinensis]
MDHNLALPGIDIKYPRKRPHPSHAFQAAPDKNWFDGQGAIACTGVFLIDHEPMWLGGGESSFYREMQSKFDDIFPALNKIEKSLARRKDLKDREKFWIARISQEMKP